MDEIVEQSDGGREAVTGVQNAALVHIRRNHFGNFLIQVILEQIYFFVPHVDQRPDAHDQQDHDRRQNRRQVDVNHALQPAGAVDGGGLVQFRADPGQRCNVNHRAPSGALPHARPDVHMPEHAGLRQKVNPVAAQRRNRMVHDADRRRKHHVNHADQHHCRDKVRRIQDGLRHFPDFGCHFVQQQRQKNREREADEHRI